VDGGLVVVVVRGGGGGGGGGGWCDGAVATAKDAVRPEGSRRRLGRSPSPSGSMVYIFYSIVRFVRLLASLTLLFVYLLCRCRLCDDGFTVAAATKVGIYWGGKCMLFDFHVVSSDLLLLARARCGRSVFSTTIQ
jgi:hypothetical protein